MIKSIEMREFQVSGPKRVTYFILFSQERTKETGCQRYQLSIRSSSSHVPTTSPNLIFTWMDVFTSVIGEYEPSYYYCCKLIRKEDDSATNPNHIAIMKFNPQAFADLTQPNMMRPAQFNSCLLFIQPRKHLLYRN